MVKKLRIKESAYNNVDYGELIEKNRDKIADMLVDKAHDMFGTYEQDLYIYPDGKLSWFDNVGGNSWQNVPHYVVFSTGGYEYADATDGIYKDELLEIFKDYDPSITKYLEKLVKQDDYYDTVDELIHGENIEEIICDYNNDAYNEMINDIIDNDYDYNWAYAIIDDAIEQSYLN